MKSSKPLEAILMDVGGPIVDERMDFTRGMEIISSVISDALGREITTEEVEAARMDAVRSYAPSFTRAVIWHFVKPDIKLTKKLHKAVSDEFFHVSRPVTLMDGVLEACDVLSKNYILALAGNQVSTIRERLQPTGILDYFKSTLVSDDLRLQKPDTRFFLEVCALINVAPENCCMVGDRLDNDIFPANIMGMRTVWIKVGPHAVQDTRMPEDVPDITITRMSELVPAIKKLDPGFNRK